MKSLRFNIKNCLKSFDKCLQTAVDLFLPRLCLSCNKKISYGYLCSNCQEKIVFLKPPLCQYCSKPIPTAENPICKKCSNDKFFYDRIISIIEYKDPIVSLIHLFKYKNYDFIAGFFSQLMIKHLEKIKFDINGYDLITSIPMHKNKLKIRGYNQSEILAKLLSNYFKMPFSSDIMTVINIRPSQARLRQDKRKENIEGVFQGRKNLKNKNLILIDDIFTTGSTVNSCCQEFKRMGANIITVITLAKA